MKKLAFLLAILIFATAFLSCDESSSIVIGGSTSSNKSTTSSNKSTTQKTTTAKNEESTPATQKRVSFVAAGDHIIHGFVYIDAENNAGGDGYDFSPMYSGVKKTIQSADIAFVNFEGVLDTSKKVSGYPSFNAPKEVRNNLIDAGFDIVNLANNHMLDCGDKSHLKTAEYFSKSVFTIGSYTSQKEFLTKIPIYEEQGIKIAVLSYTTLTNYYPTTDTVHIPYLDDNMDGSFDSTERKNIENQIALAKSLSDVVIVSVHWGNEDYAYSDESDVFSITNQQKMYANFFAENGVDVVIGHHPHVVQKIEYIGDTLVAYSLGNFLSNMSWDRAILGGLLCFDIVKDKSGARIENPIFEPVVCHYERYTGYKGADSDVANKNYKVYLLKDYTSSLANNHGINKHGNTSAFTLDTLKNYVKKNIDKKFLSI